MGFGTWLKKAFRRIGRIFKQFIGQVFDRAAKIFIAEMKDIGIAVVKELAGTDMTNEEKRKAAFKRLKKVAIENGHDAKDSLINLLIEMSLQYTKRF